MIRFLRPPKPLTPLTLGHVPRDVLPRRLPEGPIALQVLPSLPLTPVTGAGTPQAVLPLLFGQLDGSTYLVGGLIAEVFPLAQQVCQLIVLSGEIHHVFDGFTDRRPCQMPLRAFGVCLHDDLRSFGKFGCFLERPHHRL